MARIVADRGIQYYQKPKGGSVRYHEFDLDCSCTLRVDESYMFRVGRRDLTSRIQQVADAHICEVEVFMVHTEAAQRQRDRARQVCVAPRNAAEPPLRYMGVDVTREFANLWGSGSPAERYRREILGTFRAGPNESGLPSGWRAPRQDPGAQVQAAARQAEALRGIGVTQVIVDEVSEVGAKPKPPGKKPDQERPDRFALIELD